MSKCIHCINICISDYDELYSFLIHLCVFQVEFIWGWYS